jgi:nitroreductase
MGILDDVKKIKLPVTNLPILRAIKNRFSPRVFSSENIPQKDIEIIIEAARLAPSARNIQPWFFYQVLSGTLEFDKLLTCLPERNMWVKTAPIVIMACFDPKEPNGSDNRWALYDLGAAVLSFILQATELKYYCRQIGIFDQEKARQEFLIPDNFCPFTLIAIGKMGDEKDYQKADPEIIQKELILNSKKTVILENLKIR